MVWFFLGVLGLGSSVALYFVHRLHKRRDKERFFNTATLMITIPKEIVRRSDETAGTADLPKDFKEAIAPMDQLIASFSSLHNHQLIADWFGLQPELTFEIVGCNNLISFYLSCPIQLVSFIEKQIFSFFPSASVERVFNPNIFGDEAGVAVGTTLSQTKRFIFPIRTYKYLDADPINSLTGSMSRIGEQASVAIQIIFRPLSERWRTLPAMAGKQVLEGKTTYLYNSVWLRMLHGLIDILSGAVSQAATRKGKGEFLTQDQSGSKSWRLTPSQEDLMKAFNEKASKPGFRTILRVVATGPDEASAKLVLESTVHSFAQFNAPAWNSFREKKVSRLGHLLTDFITRSFEGAPTMILNSEELASIFHLPNRFTETPNIRWLVARTLSPPVNLPSQGVIIGESVYRGERRPVRLKEEDRLRHIFMIGKTGVGKTTLFENMIDQDIRAGKGVCFIDPLGDAIESILQKIPKERADDVILFDPSDTQRPMGLNLLEWQRNEERDFLVAEWIEIFYKLYDPNRTGIIGPQWEHWGRNAALTVMSQPEGGTLIEIPRLFTDDEFREQAIGFVKDPVVLAFWQQQLKKTADFHKSEMYNYFISKFGRFMTNDLMRNIIGQTKSAFNLRQVMDEGKILLINLAKGKIGELNSSLLGLVLVSKMQVAAFSRADTPEENRRPFYLYVDEFQNFTTDSFATILSEARKYRLSLNLTNQFIAQLTEKIRDAVIGNAGTMIVYRIGAADAEFMAKEFPGVTIDDMVNLDRFTIYVKLLIDLTPTKPFSMKGIKSPISKDPQIGQAIRQLSRLKYGKDQAVVDAEIRERTRVDEIPVPAGGNESMVKV